VLNDLGPVAATAGATLVNAVPEGLVAFADASVLSRILQNLIGNAIKYTPRGTITVSARCVGDRGAVECCVADDGAGIPAEQREHIFEKGVHDQASESGFGLGLAIVKQFVEAHGGRVSVASEETVGSTFRFTLPGRPVPTDDRNPSAATADGS
jgi:signal transduction histidine kinase